MIAARKLAKLLYLDEVPLAYVPSQEVQNGRELIEPRRRMVDRPTAGPNAARSRSVAMALYLLRCMHALLVQNQPWHEAA